MHQVLSWAKDHHFYGLVVSPPAATAAKAVLYDAMREAGISKSELALRLGWAEKEGQEGRAPGTAQN